MVSGSCSRSSSRPAGWRALGVIALGLGLLVPTGPARGASPAEADAGDEPGMRSPEVPVQRPSRPPAETAPPGKPTAAPPLVAPPASPPPPEVAPPPPPAAASAVAPASEGPAIVEAPTAPRPTGSGPPLADRRDESARYARAFGVSSGAVYAFSVGIHIAGSAVAGESKGCQGRYEERRACIDGRGYPLVPGSLFAVGWLGAATSATLAGISGTAYGRRDWVDGGLAPDPDRSRRFGIIGGAVLGTSLVGLVASRALAIPGALEQDDTLCGSNVACRVGFREATFGIFAAGAIAGTGLLSYAIARKRGYRYLRKLELSPVASPTSAGLVASGRF